MKTKWHPGQLLSTSSAYWQGCTLQAAVRLKLFSHLGSKSMSSRELASELKSDARATELLLDGLAGMGLIVKQETKYENSEEAQQFLDASSPHYMGHIILHHHHLLDGWAQLHEVVRTGAPVKKRSFGEEVERESFILGMFNLAMLTAPEVAKQIDLSERKTLLDLGGGPGTYAIAFCKENPQLQAIIFDRPTTEPFARDTVAQFGLEDRIDFSSGDFTVDDISSGPFDAAWLSHILHSNSLEQCARIIEKTVQVMEKGGVIMIHDFILDDTKDGPEFPALFSLNMLLANNDGRSYSQQEITELLLAAGVKDIVRHPFQAKNDSSILLGIVG